ncbi:hypothetical protein DFH07DRAFT_952123 [Mycena maculata]|uniref:Pentatricopeptide repeat-containing protein n=1 Tax=Mycena maculata TaxID=230809 RepID=A0AAD7K4V4_9AGAR|nr:hypothetical protein DFH07DRAFT_952123 [Mycena maculata]
MELVKSESKRDENQIRDKFRAIDLRIPSPPKVAENIVHFLFERRLFEEAVTVYQRMVEDGLLPSPSTDALFLAMAMKVSRAPPNQQLEGFKRILAYDSFTEAHFIELLDHIISLDIPPDTAAHLTRIFISVKPPGARPSRSLIAKLIDLQAEAGAIEDALATIEEYDFEASSDPAIEPYAKVIYSAPTSDQDAVDYIMGVIQEKDVPIHIIVFNSLIMRQKYTKDVRKAFAFYGLILRLAETTPLRPDATTYKELFRLLGNQYQNDYKPNASRRASDIGNVPHPRQLFADMMAMWFSTTSHPPASPLKSVKRKQMTTDRSLFLVAFRTFLYLRDYAAALVALRTSYEMGLQPTEHTYFILLRHMAREIYYDARAERTKSVLARALLGDFDPDALRGEESAVYSWIIGRLIEHNSNSEKAEGALRGPAAPRRRRIPTVEEIFAHDEKVSAAVDLPPLVSILQRALGARPTTTDVPWGEAWRRKVVAAARHEMVPKATELELWTWRVKKAPFYKV